MTVKLLDRGKRPEFGAQAVYLDDRYEGVRR